MFKVYFQLLQHAALQLQEITSSLMTQVSGEFSASSVALKPTATTVDTNWMNDRAVKGSAAQHDAAWTHTFIKERAVHHQTVQKPLQCLNTFLFHSISLHACTHPR